MGGQSPEASRRADEDNLDHMAQRRQEPVRQFSIQMDLHNQLVSCVTDGVVRPCPF